MFRKQINDKYTISEAWTLCYGDYPPSGKCFCPFHDNTNTPAAKVYPYGLRCFGSCGRVYRAYDLLSLLRPDIIAEEKATLQKSLPIHRKITQSPPPKLSGSPEEKMKRGTKLPDV